MENEATMAESDDGRVEARIGMTGRGLSATPERIEALQRDAEKTARLRRPKPSQSFEAVLAGRAGSKTAAPPSAAPVSAAALSVKEAGRAALPKKGPAPGMRRPSEGDTYGLSVGPKVVLKG